MEEVVNLTREEVLEIAKTFPIVPFSNRVVITINRIDEEEGSLVMSNNILSEIQYVVAVGPMAERNVKPGDVVCLDLEKLMTSQPLDHDQTQISKQIKIDPIEVDELQYAIVNDNSFKYKYKD